MSNAPALTFDVLILGAGASGLMCALTAAGRGRRVALVDHAVSPGRKIVVSGGGKANFTNLHMDIDNFVGQAPEFCEPALAQFPPQRMLDFFASHDLAWEEREHGQLFGRAQAGVLVDALVRDCAKGKYRFFLEQRIIAVEKHGDGFCVRLEGRELHSASLVLALGSPAWPQVGATEAGSHWARQLGHSVSPFRPVLAPLRMPASWPLHGLAGISLSATLSTGGYVRTDDVLFTHDGLSGPAALHASCHWCAGQPLTVDFLPHTALSALLDAPECGKLLPRTLFSRHMPQRLADALLPAELARRKIAELSRAARNALCAAVHAHTVIPEGTAGMRRAEAAAGGVRTDELDPWSMESLRSPGLYIIGELVDIAGHLGGYNLHWAWASGALAGTYA